MAASWRPSTRSSSASASIQARPGNFLRIRDVRAVWRPRREQVQRMIFAVDQAVGMLVLLAMPSERNHVA